MELEYDAFLNPDSNLESTNIACRYYQLAYVIVWFVESPFGDRTDLSLYLVNFYLLRVIKI